MKDPSPKQQLLEAVSSQDASDAEVQTLIDKLQEESPEKKPAASAKTQGKWRLLWSMQVTYAGFSTLTPAGCVMLLHACRSRVSDMNVTLGDRCIICTFHSFSAHCLLFWVVWMYMQMLQTDSPCAFAGGLLWRTSSLVVSCGYMLDIYIYIYIYIYAH